MRNRILASVITAVITAFILGCASSPEELAREAENLKQMQSLAGNWRQSMVYGKPSMQAFNFHYEFKLEKNKMVVYSVRDKDEGLGLKGDTSEYLRFTLNGRRLEETKMFYEKDVLVRGVLNESFNEIYWTWELPGVTDFSGEQAYFQETLRRE